MVCDHIPLSVAQKDLNRVTRAAEAVFACSSRPVLGLGRESTLRCVHSDCLLTSSRGVFVCIQCTHVSCRCVASQKTEPCSTNGESKEMSHGETHLNVHFSSSGHVLFLSVEHMHLFCAKCDDFVFDRYMDTAIAAISRATRASRAKFTSTTSPLEATVQSMAFPEEPLIVRMQKKRRLLTVEEWVPSKRELNSISKHSKVLCSQGYKLRPPIGLANLGNSCYMNSVLQAFLNAPPLRNFFLADEHKMHCQKQDGSGCLACAIDRLICDSCFDVNNFAAKGNGGSSPTTLKVPFAVPHDVLDIIWRNAAHLATYAQHDAHEFLIAALNVLSTHCRPDKHIQDPQLGPSASLFPTEWKEEKPSNAKALKPDANRNVSPVSPISNVRAEQGGNFVDPGQSMKYSASSIIQSLFSGTLQSDVICRVCGNSSLTLEKFYDISLDVDKLVKGSSSRRSRAQSPASGDQSLEGNHGSLIASRTNQISPREDRTGVKLKEGAKETASPNDPAISNGLPTGTLEYVFDGNLQRDFDTANSLEECLSRFTEPELLGSSSKMHCTRCGTRQESMKQMSIRTLPPIVCFHFKRFEQSFANIRKSEMIKIDTPVDFPADGLDLSNFRTSSVLRRRKRTNRQAGSTTVHSALLAAAQTKMIGKVCNKTGTDEVDVRNNKEAVYDLFAVVNHNGRIDSGHYTAMVRKKGTWYRCDDEKVAMMPAVEKVIRSEEAYLVFYAQRYPNLQFPQC